MKDKALNDEIAANIFSLSRFMKDEMAFDSDTAQLTLLQIHALIFIKKNNTVTMTEVANQFNISLPTATSLSNKLVSAKLIKRQNDKNDRRIVKLILTEKGEKLLKEAMEARSKKINTLLSYIPKKEKEELLKILKNLLVHIQ